jgi:hypothetical protein
MAKFTLFALTLFHLPVCAQLLNDKNYAGMYNKSIWEYEFYTNETFWYRSQGRVGNRESTGKFQIIGDTVFLNSVETDTTKWKFKTLKGKKLLILKDSCLLDLQTGYDYCTKYFQFYGDSVMLFPSTRRFKPSKPFFKHK